MAKINVWDEGDHVKLCIPSPHGGYDVFRVVKREGERLGWVLLGALNHVMPDCAQMVNPNTLVVENEIRGKSLVEQFFESFHKPAPSYSVGKIPIVKAHETRKERWEYKVLSLLDGDAFSMSELSKGGWEVLSAKPEVDQPHANVLFCKRALKEREGQR